MLFRSKVIATKLVEEVGNLFGEVAQLAPIINYSCVGGGDNDDNQ